MFRRYPYQLQFFARQIVAIFPGCYETKQIRTIATKSSENGEVVVIPELGASFFSKHIGK